MSSVIERLEQSRNLSDGELLELLQTDRYDAELAAAADRKRREIYKDEVYIR